MTNADFRAICGGAIIGILLLSVGAALFGIAYTPRTEIVAAVIGAIVTALWICHDIKPRKS